MTVSVLFASAVVGYALGIATVVVPLIERRRELPSSDWSESDFGDHVHVSNLSHFGTNTTGGQRDHVRR